jgi:hypothetical protein
MCEGLGPFFAGAKPCMDFTTSSTKPSKILRHVETADPTRSARIRSAIRQIEETIVLAREAGLVGKAPANSNAYPSD